MRRLAILDGDARFARWARRTFEHEGYEVECYDSAEQGVVAVGTRMFDLVLIDVGHEGERVDVCRRIREEVTADIPVVAVTGNPEVHPEALLAGADESIIRTVSERELLARVAAVMRRVPKGFRSVAAYADENLQIYPEAMRVVRDGSEIILSKGESDVLGLLLRNAPASLPVERIRQELNAASSPVTRSAIEARLKSLRRKIGHDLIENRLGFGYSFTASQKRRA